MRGGDRFGALQDNILKHVLSFLPSRDAVKSAAFARRWRHLWRSTSAAGFEEYNSLLQSYT
jgi:hypothetical protein